MFAQPYPSEIRNSEGWKEVCDNNNISYVASHRCRCGLYSNRNGQRRKINQAMLIISSCLEPTGPFMGISCNQTCTADPHDSEAPGSSRMQAWTNEEANLVATGILLTLRRIRSGHGHASAYRRHRLTAAHCSKYTAQAVWISFWNTLMAAAKSLLLVVACILNWIILCEPLCATLSHCSCW